MAFSVVDYLVTDDLTILLGLISATVFLLHNLYKPQPLVHPILLGRQSDVARVRNPGESAVYRNYGTGLMGRFPARPAKEVEVLADFVKVASDAPRTLWSTKITNPRLAERVSAVGTGLIRVAGLVPRESSVFILLNDNIEFLIADLALASHSIRSFTLSSTQLLSPLLEAYPKTAIITHAEFLPQLLELIYDGDHTHSITIILVGTVGSSKLAKDGSQHQIINWTDLESQGAASQPVVSPAPKPDDVFTVSFFASENGEPRGTQLTHENLTAGVTATRALLPLSAAISSLDTLVSAHNVGTPYGRSILYTAVLEGTNFATLESTKLYRDENSSSDSALYDVVRTKLMPIPPPTIIFVQPRHLEAITESIINKAKNSMLAWPFAWRHKRAGVAEGFISKEGMWDRLVFDSAREKSIGELALTLRGVIVSGGPVKASLLTSARIALSVPVVNAFTHPISAAPLLASHPLDLQSFTDDSDANATAHTGPPSINVEVKMVGVDDEAVERGDDPVGLLSVRGPSVGRLLSGEQMAVDAWIETGAKALAQTNGAFKML